VPGRAKARGPLYLPIPGPLNGPCRPGPVTDRAGPCLDRAKFVACHGPNGRPAPFGHLYCHLRLAGEAGSFSSSSARKKENSGTAEAAGLPIPTSRSRWKRIGSRKESQYSTRSSQITHEGSPCRQSRYTHTGGRHPPVPSSSSAGR
jgi:hypothetical protein